MLRRADCTILVIESAKSTRKQIRAAAASLRRLNPEAVRFVLNRVSLKNADKSFRDAVNEVERHAGEQERNSVRTVKTVCGDAPEAPPVRLMRETQPKSEPAPARRFDSAEPNPPEAPAKQASWWMDDAQSYTERPVVPLLVPRVGRWHFDAVQDEHEQAEPKQAEQAAEPAKEAPEKPPTRLSDLRSLHFTLAVKGLKSRSGSDEGRSERKGDSPPARLAEALHTSFGSEQTAALPLPTAQTAPEPAVVVQPYAFTVIPKDMCGQETVILESAPGRVTPEPEALPTPVEETSKDKESSDKVRSLSNKPDGIQILPSRRGQYRR
jgi:hypothetical protein